MKKALIALVMVALLYGGANACEVMRVDLTRSFQMELYRQHRYEDLSNFEERFPADTIPIEKKIEEFNLIMGGRDFTIVAGDFFNDYFVVVKVCE